MHRESGQATAEYALVMVAAALIAVALITWASGSDVLPDFFNSVVQRVRGLVSSGS
jgi:Flp pilus assembly pilin Flp